jgi:hypothetical protein
MRYILQVKPDGVGPLWWSSARVSDERIGPTPKVIEFQWMTATENGGFTAGIDEKHAVDANGVSQRVEEWYEEREDDPWPWQFRMIELPE